MPPRKPRWEMDEQERDARPRPSTSGDTARSRRVSAMDSLRGDLTPPPHDISPQDAWEHTSAVAKRTADALMEIAAGAGVGMNVGNDVQQNTKDIGDVKKKLKWWQAMAIAALTAAGSALFGVARLLYERGARDGVNEMRLELVEKQTARNAESLDHIRDEMRDLIRFKILGKDELQKPVDPVRNP